MNSDEKQRWERYLYPGTSVLRNKLGITDLQALRDAELDLTFSRKSLLNARYDGKSKANLREELSSIHATLFSDLYEWAGQFRDVNMTKQMAHVPGKVSVFINYKMIPESLDQIDTAVRAYHWGSANFNEKTQMLAKVHAMLDYVHPFREGNGRSTRIIMEHLARANGVNLDWGAVPYQKVIEASAEIFRQEKARSTKPMEMLYQKIASPRPNAQVQHATEGADFSLLEDPGLDSTMMDNFSASPSGDYQSHSDSPIINKIFTSGNDYVAE